MEVGVGASTRSSPEPCSMLQQSRQLLDQIKKIADELGGMLTWEDYMPKPFPADLTPSEISMEEAGNSCQIVSGGHWYKKAATPDLDTASEVDVAIEEMGSKLFILRSFWERSIISQTVLQTASLRANSAFRLLYRISMFGLVFVFIFLVGILGKLWTLWFGFFHGWKQCVVTAPCPARRIL